MLQLDNTIEKINAVGIVLITSVVFLLISVEANTIQRQISGNSDLLSVFSTVNNVVAFILPLLSFTFFTVTTKIMLSVLDLQNKNTPSVAEIVGFSFLPVLVFAIFYLANFVFYTRGISISSASELQQINFLFNLNLKDFKTLSLFCWGALYIVLFFKLKHHFKTTLNRALLLTIVPSLILVTIKILIGQF